MRPCEIGSQQRLTRGRRGRWGRLLLLVLQHCLRRRTSFITIRNAAVIDGFSICGRVCMCWQQPSSAVEGQSGVQRCAAAALAVLAAVCSPSGCSAEALGARRRVQAAMRMGEELGRAPGAGDNWVAADELPRSVDLCQCQP